MADLDKRMGTIFVDFDISKKENADVAAIIECRFDAVTDEDDREIAVKMVQAKVIKRICWAKTLLFIPDYLVGLLLLPSYTVDRRVAIQRKIWAHLRGRIGTQEIITALAGMGV